MTAVGVTVKTIGGVQRTLINPKGDGALALMADFMDALDDLDLNVEGAQGAMKNAAASAQDAGGNAKRLSPEDRKRTLVFVRLLSRHGFDKPLLDPSFGDLVQCLEVLPAWTDMLFSDPSFKAMAQGKPAGTSAPTAPGTTRNDDKPKSAKAAMAQMASSSGGARATERADNP